MSSVEVQNPATKENDIGDELKNSDKISTNATVDEQNKMPIADSTTSSKPLKKCAEALESDTEDIGSLLVALPETFKRKKVNLYAEDTGPQIHEVKGTIVTPPIITKNLPKVFEYLPIFGKPKSKSELDEFFKTKVRDFVGCGLDDDEYDDLQKYCSPENLKIGKELRMRTKVPINGLLIDNILDKPGDTLAPQEPSNLSIVKKCKFRMEKDAKGLFVRKLKYRGLKVIPLPQEDLVTDGTSSCDEELEPGKDILYKVRVYRPYQYTRSKDRQARTRHSVLCCDIVVCGRQPLTALRDRFVCHNDLDMRVDVSNNPDIQPTTTAKEMFPSGFLFINNVFYVDTREGCHDYSAPIREWALKRGLGDFAKRDMAAVTLDQLVLKLGHPDVYVHQGNCEHVFIFSEVRLLNATDPLRLSQYPCSTAVGQNQSMYCTTCAEYCAKWIVVGCLRVPFDPAFFCEICFKQYLYKDGKKIGDFKAYSYKGNALNILKPQ